MTPPTVPGPTRPAGPRPPVPADRYEAGGLDRPGGLPRLREGLAADGLAVFAGVGDPAALLAAAVTVMTVVAHPDAGPDAVTTITDLGPAGDRPGQAGFSRRGLPAHTDRSGVVEPPGLLMVVCGQTGTAGGDAHLSDGQAVHADLAATAPHVLAAFHRPRSVLFGGSGGHLGAVFTEPDSADGPGRCRLRLRLDDLAAFGPGLAEYLPVLAGAIARHTITLPLAPGRGYLLDNHRWLHARTAFTGDRIVYRVLGNPLPELGLRTGIPLPAQPEPGNPLDDLAEDLR